MPFYTALAALLKLHKQEIRGAFALPVFLGEEAAQREDTEDKASVPFK
jgi:glutamate formiminotransferase